LSTNSLSCRQTKKCVDITRFNPCAADGAGEDVHLTGDANAVFHLTLDNAGGAHGKGNFNWQGVSGTGLTTGDKYQATRGSNQEINTKVGQELTFVEKIQLIGQGAGNNNQMLYLILHFTVNPDGTVTSNVANIRIECH
jgi:hypothetical protein